jgi:pyruvate dehydrogenase (quinone)
MTTVAEMMIEALAEHGVRTVWGVVGDALNPVTDAIRREDRIDWVGVRHEEAGAFAAGAQAQLSGGLGVCMGTVGPGSLHLLNGLYDAAKSHAPVLAICGQVPREEMGTDFFQEVDNDAVFADVAVFNRTVTSVDQMPGLLEQAVNTALAEQGVAVLTLPGDVGGLDMPKDAPTPTFVAQRPLAAPSLEAVRQVADVVNAAGSVTLLVGLGARHARDEVLQVAERLSAPMVLTLKAKDGFEDGNDFEIGQSGLLGNPATATAFEGCDVLMMLGTDFPYRDFLPADKTVVQLDVRGEHIGRRTAVDHALVGDTRLGLQQLLPMLEAKPERSHLDKARQEYDAWRARQQELADPGYDRRPTGLLRRKVDNADRLIRPEVLAAAINRHAAPDAVFTSDTGMATVWLSRFVTMTGTRRLIGSYNLGSMANAMPQALGAAALDPARQVVALCGDGGLSMLMGDLITAVSYDLPVKLVVFDNSRLGMVKLEMEQVGLPEHGTVLANPDFAAVARAVGLHGVRVSDPDEVDAAVRDALAHPGPVLLDVVTNPDEVALPPKPTLTQGWGFAIAKSKEFLESHGS